MFIDIPGLNAETELARKFYGSSDGIFESEFKSDTKREQWLVFAASSAILTLFSSFERRFSDGVSSFVSFLDNNKIPCYSEDSHKDKYKKSLNNLLGRLNWEKYKHLTEVSIVSSYLNFLQGSGEPRFVTEAVLLRDQNLRVETINEILSRVGLKDLEEWIVNTPALQSRYEKEELLRKFKADWNELLQLRNDVAHGNLDSVPGTQLFDEYLTIVRTFSNLLGEYLTKKAIELDSQHIIFQHLGDVSQYFDKAKAAIVPSKKSIQLGVGDTVFLVGKFRVVQTKVLSLQRNGVDAVEFIAEADGIEIGLKFENNEVPHKPGTSVYCLTSSPRPAV